LVARRGGDDAHVERQVARSRSVPSVTERASGHSIAAIADDERDGGET
jgi:hypothetical protein